MATKRLGKLELYKDKHGDWRWRTIAANGKVTADSGEGYKRRAGAIKGAVATAHAILRLMADTTTL
jgi:uncharacterized protein YegP (UPF0339 family)